MFMKDLIIFKFVANVKPFFSPLLKILLLLLLLSLLLLLLLLRNDENAQGASRGNQRDQGLDPVQVRQRPGE